MITKSDGTVSKTMIFNIIGLIVAVVGPILASYGYTGELPAEWGVFVPAIIAAVNLILRKFFTNQPLA